MTAENLDNFQYEPSSKHDSLESRRHYWAVAIGLQAVDGLKVSKYAREVAEGYIAGKYSLEEAGDLVRMHYSSGNAETDVAKEADLVSQRIVELLSASPFHLSSEFLSEIHSYLFQDLDHDVYHPGEFKHERMIKQEDILNGDSVLYADPSTYKMSLRAAFEREQEASYTYLEGDELDSFIRGIAFLWQIHPFYEGNTRTIAVFSELYLRYLGFKIGNEPFQSDARYYRDALVRAVYRNPHADAFPDFRFLTSFYERALGRSDSMPSREDMLVVRLFENPDLLRNVSANDALSMRLEG